MRDLALSLPDLDPSQRRKAHAVLARPTDGNNDAYGDGYTVPAKRKCRGNFCIHWVTSTSDAATTTWADRTLTADEPASGTTTSTRWATAGPSVTAGAAATASSTSTSRTWAPRASTATAPPRTPRPATSTSTRATACSTTTSPARSTAHRRSTASRVTAAHEFFHAVQFAYDASEDPWLMEATATWMEERYADSINDNRQYLPYGQVQRPGSPLDFANSTSFNQYGNWPFFEYLCHPLRQPGRPRDLEPGRRVQGRPRPVLHQGHQGGPRRPRRVRAGLRAYAAGNTIPARTYPEGAAWPSAAIAKRLTLSRSHQLGSASFTIDHLASANAAIKPDTSLEGPQWRAGSRSPARDAGPARPPT